MPTLTSSTPKYRHHKASGQAVVTVRGRDHYLGPWKSRASRLLYDQLVGEWIAAGRPSAGNATADLRIVELIQSYWKFAKSYYVKDGKSTGTAENMKPILSLLRKLYGQSRVVDFGPLALKSLQTELVRQGKARVYVNKLIDMLRRMFRWAVAEEMIPASVIHALAAVPGLRKGRTTAPERAPIIPVTDQQVEATLPNVSPIVADMIRFQRLTGARPAEICIVRPCDVEIADKVWIYRPQLHKMEHYGRERVLFIGPKAQEVLRPYLRREPLTYCFVPAEGEAQRSAKRRAERQSPMTPSQARRTRKKHRRRAPGPRYTTASYYRAIERACDETWPAPAGLNKAELKTWKKSHRWAPNRLRHTAGTEIRKRFGLEAAQVTLGHASADVTQVYAERDLALAARIMQEIG